MKSSRFHVYSSLLGGYLATGFESRAEAEQWLADYRRHDPVEAAQSSVIQAREG